MPRQDEKMSKLIDEIYEYTGLIFSDFRAKGFQKLIDKKIADASPSVEWPVKPPIKQHYDDLENGFNSGERSMHDKFMAVMAGHLLE